MTKLYLHNITQVYVQSTLDLNWNFFIYPLSELITMIGALLEYILKIVKPFYDVSEAGNYLFATYYNYHINIFIMFESTYNPYLFHRFEPFSIVELQTNDTLILANNSFAHKEDKAIKTAKFITKE